MTSILIIEFDPVIGRMLQDGFESEGFQIIRFRDGQNGLEYALHNHIDLIVLNLMVPGVDGWHILRKLRQEARTTPVIILSAQDAEREKIRAFNEGCDDFVAIPFSLHELFGRAKAILRRVGSDQNAPRLLKSGGFTLDLQTQQAVLEGSEINLTKSEFMILALLIRSEGEVVRRYRILDEIWGEEVDVTTRTVDMHIHRIRSKWQAIGKCIITVYQKGYKWEQPVIDIPSR
ncbi:MAG: response regulator transcription factor [Candidatus Hatepunaea meridiana]|nr:response regulator transcription factor [Candidatus Hatepunaea meridiana]